MQADKKTIYFYSKDDPFGFLSNFYHSPFSVGDKIYKTNEHYFQSKKYYPDYPDYEQQVIDAKKPGEAFMLARNRKIPIRADWQAIKEGIMYEGLRLKFNTHKNLCKMLLETGEDDLIEHTVKDRYWADGGDGSGKNRLGVLLMRLRSEIRKSRQEELIKKQ